MSASAPPQTPPTPSNVEPYPSFSLSSSDSPDQHPHNLLGNQPHHQPLSPSSSSSLPTPSPLFLLTFFSLPLALGSYYGYRRALTEDSLESSKMQARLKKLSPKSPQFQSLKNTTSTTNAMPKAHASIMAAKALGVGTLLSLSFCSALVFGVGYVFSCSTSDDYVALLNRSGRSVREALKHFGIEESVKVEEDRKVIKGMNKEEEEEWAWKKLKGEE
ncbi:hypothetical protein TrST_g12328 [Triparma strigata]|uniref:Transmembrane protein 242 n=2 Tax=Triparma TaxID=722752 RepID=A0A9W7E996_9STRA|nr:hypothetical protein TrST_g12328 [Triparma strigata]